MIKIRRAEDRGHANHGWLDTNHTFSFADYYDPNFMGFRTLRVLNEDRVAGGGGFGRHTHRDMEIISYVLEGTLAHSDSMGTGSLIKPGEVQRMSAGTGVAHSEMNPSDDQPVHFLQIWIIPKFTGIKPGYEQKAFAQADKRGRLALVGSPDGAEGSITIHQDVRLYAGSIVEGYLHVVRGRVTANGRALEAGDALRYRDESEVSIEGGSDAEVLVFDLPPMD